MREDAEERLREENEACNFSFAGLDCGLSTLFVVLFALFAPFMLLLFWLNGGGCYCC